MSDLTHYTKTGVMGGSTGIKLISVGDATFNEKHFRFLDTLNRLLRKNERMVFLGLFREVCISTHPGNGIGQLASLISGINKIGIIPTGTNKWVCANSDAQGGGVTEISRSKIEFATHHVAVCDARFNADDVFLAEPWALTANNRLMRYVGEFHGIRRVDTKHHDSNKRNSMAQSLIQAKLAPPSDDEVANSPYAFFKFVIGILFISVGMFAIWVMIVHVCLTGKRLLYVLPILIFGMYLVRDFLRA